jgi:hypothetical protein
MKNLIAIPLTLSSPLRGERIKGRGDDERAPVRHCSLPVWLRQRCVAEFHRFKKSWSAARPVVFKAIGIVALSACSLASNAVQWQAGPGYRDADLPVSKSGRTGFALLPESLTGIAFTNHLSDAKAAENQNRLGGSGVALGDVDGDGWCDIYFCRMEGPNVLYRNLGGWKFEDVTESAGVACPGQFSTGAVFGDVDGDGDLDLLVNSLGGGTRIFFNDGRGHFAERLDCGLVRKLAGMSMALADMDGDGDLDLYVANYRTQTVRSTGLDILRINGKRVLKPEDRKEMYFTPDGFLREYGEVDSFYRNDGNGQFTLLPWTGGMFLDETGKPLTEPPRDWGLSVMFRDLNGDGAPDIYVCNDFWSPDRIWINDGAGKHFRAVDRVALANTSTFSMGIDFADINRDGLDDFIVLDMLSPHHLRRMTQSSLIGLVFPPIGLSAERPQVERNTLFLNRGDGTYAEIAQLSGVHASEWSWCPIFLDIDLDGFEDLLISNGNAFDTQDADAETQIDARAPWPKEKVPFKLLMYPRLPAANLAFRNRGDLTFTNMSAEWGFNDVGISQGMALGDLDNDGDLDVVVNNMNSAAGIYRNETIAARLAVRLKGQPPNTRGIGGKIKVLGGPVPQSQEMICGGRYLSGDDSMRVFAARSNDRPFTIEVAWRSGKRSVVINAQPNRLYEIDEPRDPQSRPLTPTLSPDGGEGVRRTGEGQPQPPGAALSANSQPAPVNSQPFFQDVSQGLNHLHHEEAFDDFARQPSLPNRLSQLGPGVSWFDVDGDGWDDLIIGSGRGGQLAVYRNDGHGGLARWNAPPVSQPVTRDQTTVLGWQKAAGRVVLLAGSSNYEDGLPLGASVRQYDLAARTIDDSLPGQRSSTGPMAMADFDGDGDLDLFVGGRVLPGRYPEAASSRLFRNDGGVFHLDEENSKALEGIGLVSGVVFSDLDGDGFPELILACEWGPLRILRNQRGALTPWNPTVTFADRSAFRVPRSALGELTGWWNGVATGDFDNDGKLDIVASNWGRNTKYEDHRAQPLRLYHGDLDGNGTPDVIEAYFDMEMGKLVPERALDSMAKAMPFLRERFSTHRVYAEAGLAEIFGDRLNRAKELQASTLESMVFLNRGDHFEAKPLPIEAQFAPAFGVCAGDFDGDGNEDIFLSQNFFSTQPETSPYDAGRGLWLRGDGKGGFSAVSGQESGIKIYGEQRGAALCDYDGDGKIDLAVTQNGAETKLFHNVGARPGLRVRLKGPVANPHGVGAWLRLGYGQRQGPAREIHAGSGYWSQDSAVQVFGTPGRPVQFSVRWPGGKTISAAIPDQAREIEVDHEGKVNPTKDR